MEEALHSFTQKPSKILIVDSQDKSRTLLKRRLAIYGHEIFSAANSDEALSWLEKRSIDVIFLNVMLEGVDGLDFLKQLKKHHTYVNIPVIMVSKDVDIEVVVRCIEAGAEDYLAKPLNQTLLKARLSSCVAKKEARDKEIAYLEKIEQGQKQIVAQEKMASIGVLVSSISQELKNPLNFVINFASVSADVCGELLEQINDNKNVIDEPLRQQIDTRLNTFKTNVTKISQYGQSADKIIRFMMDQSNASGGKKHPENINRIITQTITMLFSSYKTNGITELPKIQEHFDSSMKHIPVVTQALSKAIYNIVDNALYFVIKKHENISDAEIHITTKANEDTVEIIIYDNGIGIADAIKDKIFTAFFTTKEADLSPGLGLSTAKEVIDDHDGTIAVRSEPNSFAEFTITLPKK